MSHYQQPQRGDPTFAVVGIITVVLLIGGAFILSSSGTAVTPSAGAPSKLEATESSYDFGTISMANGKVTKQFLVKNSTATPMTVQKVYTSCMCTTATLIVEGNRVGPFGMPGHGIVPTISQTIAPGTEAVVEVTFDPAAHGPSGVGPINRNVYVETTDGGKLSFEFKAQVTP